MTKRPAANGALQTTAAPLDVAMSVLRTDPVESYLRRLVAGCADPPLVDQLTADDLGTPCGTASIARAALCWWRDGLPDQIAERLREELADADHLARWRTRQAVAELEEALRQFRRGRRHIVSFEELQRRRQGVA
jgi:hypothetical protein